MRYRCRPDATLKIYRILQNQVVWGVVVWRHPSPDCIPWLNVLVNASRNAWSHDSIARGGSLSLVGPEFFSWLSRIWPSVKAGKPMPSWVYPLVVAWFALGMVDWCWLLCLLTCLGWLPMYRRLGCMWHDACLISLDNLLFFDSRAYMPEIVIYMILHVFFGPCDLSCVYQFTPLFKQCLGFCGSWRRWNCNLASCHRAWSPVGVGFMLLPWHRRLVSSWCVCDHELDTFLQVHPW